MIHSFVQTGMLLTFCKRWLCRACRAGIVTVCSTRVGPVMLIVIVDRVNVTVDCVNGTHL